MIRPRSTPTTVFLDRDGTVNVKAADGYITRPQHLRLLPGAAHAVRRLNESGLRVIVVTNQRGVTRGLMSPDDLRAVHVRLTELLAAGGGRLDAIYACVHNLGACRCRKPMPGLLLRAAAEDPGVRLDQAVMVGDSESDVEAGIRAGAVPIRLAQRSVHSAADVIEPDLGSAVDWILQHHDHPEPMRQTGDAK